MVRAAAGDADALGAVAAEVSRAIDAGEWVAAVVDDDKEEGALFWTDAHAVVGDVQGPVRARGGRQLCGG